MLRMPSSLEYYKILKIDELVQSCLFNTRHGTVVRRMSGCACPPK